MCEGGHSSQYYPETLDTDTISHNCTESQSVPNLSIATQLRCTS